MQTTFSCLRSKSAIRHALIRVVYKPKKTFFPQETPNTDNLAITCVVKRHCFLIFKQKEAGFLRPLYLSYSKK